MSIEVLCVGKDEMLLTTRRWLMQRYVASETSHDLSSTALQLKDHVFAAVVLCHTLSEEERDAISELVRLRSPQTEVVCVNPLTERRGAGCASCGEFRLDGSPGALVKQIAGLAERRGAWVPGRGAISQVA